MFGAVDQCFVVDFVKFEAGEFDIKDYKRRIYHNTRRFEHAGDVIITKATDDNAFVVDFRHSFSEMRYRV